MSIKKLFGYLFLLALVLTGVFFSMDHQVLAAEKMTLGSQGQDVRELQTALNSKDYWNGEPNGLFGPRTYNALIRFQRDHKLAVNGKVDEVTQKVLGMFPGTPVQPQIKEPSVSKVQVKPQPSPANTQTAPAKTAAPASSNEVSRGSSRVINMVATGYTDAPEENWPYAGAPSYIGLPLARGMVAVDPNVIPMGTKIYVEGYGPAIAADQGGAIKGNRIDLFFDSKAEANNWGMKSVKVTIY